MTHSAIEFRIPRAVSFSVTPDTLEVALDDGRTIAAPLAWFPRLLHGTAEERSRARLIGQGEGLHWPDLDEDVSVESLLAGRPSAESAASLKRWLAGRAGAARITISLSSVPINIVLAAPAVAESSIATLLALRIPLRFAQDAAFGRRPLP